MSQSKKSQELTTDAEIFRVMSLLRHAWSPAGTLLERNTAMQQLRDLTIRLEDDISCVENPHSLRAYKKEIERMHKRFS